MDTDLRELDRRVDELEKGFAGVRSQLSTLATLAKIIAGLVTPGAIETVGHYVRPPSAAPPPAVYQLPPPVPRGSDPSLPPEYSR